jgi:hypothetical protein
MFVATVTRIASERRGYARRGGARSSARNLAKSPEAVSPPQIMRLAVLVLLAALCIGLSNSPRTGHAEEQRTSHALGAKTLRTPR